MADPIRITGVWKDDGSYYFSDDSGGPRTESMNPAELLIAAVVGCTGITMHAIMNKMKINHQGFTITGLARKADEKPTWIRKVSIDAAIHGAQMTDTQRTKLLELTEKYCLVAQTLQRSADVRLNIDSL